MSEASDFFDALESPEDVDFDLSDDSTEELPEEAGDLDVEDEGFEDDADGDEDGDEAAGDPVLSLLQEMRAELTSLREQVKNGGAAEAAPPEPTAIDFVDEASFDAAVSSREGLNKLLNTVHQAGHASAMQLLPTLVREQAEAVYEQKMRVESFFRSNPDLDKVRPLVSVVAKEVAEEFPESNDYKKLFVEIAKRTRARVSGAKGGGRGASTKHRNPGSVPTGAGRPGSGRPRGRKTENVAAEIKKMMQL